MDFLENGNDVSDVPGIADGDGGDGIDNDTLEKVKDEFVGNDGGRQHGWSSYYNYSNKGCRNKDGGKGSSGYEYDL